MKGCPEQIVVRALQTRQADGIDVYAFFLYGADLCRIADISRVSREGGDLKGFQRREIRNHVKSIVEFLDTGPVLFPNAIILALSPEIEFKFARGSRPDGMIDAADSGTLTIPVRPEGQRVAWIVDGQQRSLALFQTRNTKLPFQWWRSCRTALRRIASNSSWSTRPVPFRRASSTSCSPK